MGHKDEYMITGPVRQLCCYIF